MKTETIVCCVVALLLGMLLANMLKSVCGCKTVEGQTCGARASGSCTGTGSNGLEHGTCMRLMGRSSCMSNNFTKLH